MKHSNRWSKTLSRIQREFNNFINNVVTFNEIIYDFISIQTMNWFIRTFILRNFFAKKFFLKNNRKIVRTKVSNAISFSQMQIKFHYDRKYQFFFQKKKFRVNSITSRLQNRDYRHYWKKVQRAIRRLVQNFEKNRSFNLSIELNWSFRVVKKSILKSIL